MHSHLEKYGCTMDLHYRPGGVPSHVSQGLFSPYIPSFYLSLGWRLDIAPIQGLTPEWINNPTSCSVLLLFNRIFN